MGGNKSQTARRNLRSMLRSLKSVRTWQLILIIIPLTFLGATLLRFDHVRMTTLRAEVIAADEIADSASLNATIDQLREFTFSHIVINISESNGVQKVIFGTGPFYLEQSYRRAATAAIEAAEQTMVDDSNPNGNIYESVRQICQPLAIQNGWQWSDQPYLDCWTSELAKYPTSEELTSNIVTAKLPSTELYRLDFASPVWAPTPTGFVLLIDIILIVVVLIRIIAWLVLHIALMFLDRKKR